uniref:AAA+ ATPase domain-containing protein n=1 Tax=Norrisiella sphaerica TaxID=552664 RepID=A0A7S2QTD2_9EUKA|mmetsp:Transcript_315/g.444  ORF Transcript_315/g.444 Transcript_315/m.444 type:complete len:1191 (+) Transcript_315:148-3720(+)
MDKDDEEWKHELEQESDDSLPPLEAEEAKEVVDLTNSNPSSPASQSMPFKHGGKRSNARHVGVCKKGGVLAQLRSQSGKVGRLARNTFPRSSKRGSEMAVVAPSSRRNASNGKFDKNHGLKSERIGLSQSANPKRKRLGTTPQAPKKILRTVVHASQFDVKRRGKKTSAPSSLQRMNDIMSGKRNPGVGKSKSKVTHSSVQRLVSTLRHNNYMSTDRKNSKRGDGLRTRGQGSVNTFSRSANNNAVSSSVPIHIQAKDEFLRQVLAWNLNSSPVKVSDKVLERVSQYTRVQDKNTTVEASVEAERKYSCFKSSEEYRNVFTPLFMENMRAEIESDLESLETTRIAAQLSIQGLKESRQNFAIVKLAPKEQRTGKSAIPKSFMYKAGRLAVLWLGNDMSWAVRGSSGSNSGKEQRKRLPEHHAVAYIIRAQGSCLVLQLSLPLRDESTGKEPSPSELNLDVSDYQRLRMVRDKLVQSDQEKMKELTFSVALLCHTATSVREYTALHCLEGISLLKEILDPSRRIADADVKSSGTNDDVKLQKPCTKEFDIPEAFGKRLENVLNPSQFAAVIEATHGKSFTLLQGPPGTGKTRTAVELLNTLHLSRFQQYYRTLACKIWNIVRKKAYKQEQQRMSKFPNHRNLNPTMSTQKAVFTKDMTLNDILQTLESSSQDIIVSPKPHILVCAPSNAAVDELVRRVLQQKFYDAEGQVYTPDVLRICSKEYEVACDEIFIASSLDRRVGALLQKGRDECERVAIQAGKDLAKMRSKLNELKKKAVEFMLWYNCEIIKQVMQDQKLTKPPSLDMSRWGSVELSPNHPLYVPVEALKRDLAHQMEEMQYARLCQWRHELVAKAPGNKKEAAVGDGLIKKALQTSHLNEAQIVFCTLSTAGSEAMKHKRAWDFVLIDEAAQSVELSTLVALQQQVTRCILIGDPQQLPATVTMSSANARLYQQSLFERLARAGHPVVMLDTQYRMHPDISSFPSKHFYNSRLSDAPNVQSEAWQKSFHTDSRFRPLQFFDVQSKQQRDSVSRSSFNTQEVKFVVALGKAFVQEYVWPKAEAKMLQRRVSIGIITPYSQQRRRIDQDLQRIIREERKMWSHVDLKVATVDGFQGGEKDIIIFSCVRSGGHGGIGFLADIRRMNVALTRARFGCWVVGNARALERNPHWGKFLKHCKARDCFVGAREARDMFKL